MTDGAWDLPSLLAVADSDHPTTVMIKSGIRDAPALIQVGRRLGRSSAVVVFDLSLERETEIVSTAEAGVGGLLLQTESFDRMLETLRTVEDGHATCSTEVSAVLLRRVYAFSQDINPDAGIDRLTERELEILELIAQRLTNQQIATRLTLTLQTVKNHVHRLLSKMEVASRAEAVTVYLAKQNGKPSPD
jgi:DNA-binding NarL/FixJ family response regulator